MKTNYNNFNLDEWLDYLENRYQKEIQLGLERITLVAGKLNLLSFPTTQVITVAGTNGKGSTVAFLEALYSNAGYKVGAYTSPHLLTFNERIRVNQKFIPDEELCFAFSLIEEARENTPLSYFEMTTLAALLYFKKNNLELIILEVGLGGRLDATNIIDSDLAIITTIDFNHQSFLGDTLDKIAYEKAGILRPFNPVIYADLGPSNSITNRATELNSSLYCQGKEYSYWIEKDFLHFSYADKVVSFFKPILHANAIAAGCMASFILQNILPLNDEIIIKTAENTYLEGRLELSDTNPQLLFDVSHNPQAVARLAAFLRSFSADKDIHVVFSALKDKDLQGLVNPLRDIVDYWYPAPLDNKRAANPQQIRAAFHEHSAVPYCHENIELAFKEAMRNAKPCDLIVIYGSFFTVAKIKALLAQRINES